MKEITKEYFDTQFENLASSVSQEAANLRADMATQDNLEQVTNQLSALTDRLTAVENKIAGTNRRLDGEAMQRQDLHLPERIAAIEKHLGIDAHIPA